MKGFRFLGNKRMMLDEFPRPEAEGTRVVIRVRAAALCGTDLPHYAAPPEKTLTCVPGHEIAGQIVQVDHPESFKVGDRVALTTQVGCGFCDACRQGEFLFCPNSRFVFGVTPGVNGGHGEYVLAPERACLPLPDGVEFDVGSILPDALGVGFHALRRIGGVSREKILVLGAGPIGLGVILLLKHYGAAVAVTDVRPYRLQLARSLGAEHALNPQQESLPEFVRQWTDGAGVDKAFDCAANTGETVAAALDSLKRGGTAVLLGQKEAATINPNRQVIWRQTRIVGSCAFNVSEWGDMMRLVRDGLAVDRLITHRFRFEETPTAFQVFDEGNTGKVVVLHDPD